MIRFAVSIRSKTLRKDGDNKKKKSQRQSEINKQKDFGFDHSDEDEALQRKDSVSSINSDESTDSNEVCWIYKDNLLY